MQFIVDWEDRIDVGKMRKYRLNRIQGLLKEYNLDAVISFNADNRFNASLFRLFIKLNCAVHIAVVCKRERWHFQSGRLKNKVVNL